jgi:hypothetical protein
VIKGYLCGFSCVRVGHRDSFPHTPRVSWTWIFSKLNNAELAHDVGYAGRRPGSVVGGVTLRPGAHLTLKNHFTVVRRHRDVARLELRVSRQGGADRGPDSIGRHGRLERHPVLDRPDALQVTDRTCRCEALKVPCGGTRQDDDVIVNRRLNPNTVQLRDCRVL